MQMCTYGHTKSPALHTVLINRELWDKHAFIPSGRTDAWHVDGYKKNYFNNYFG